MRGRAKRLTGSHVVIQLKRHARARPRSRRTSFKTSTSVRPDHGGVDVLRKPAWDVSLLLGHFSVECRDYLSPSVPRTSTGRLLQCARNVKPDKGCEVWLIQDRWSSDDSALFSSKTDMSAAVSLGLTANWKPLEGWLSPALCGEFMWMYRENGVEQYKHIETRRYLRLDASGRCLIFSDGNFKEVSFEDEWKRVTGRGGRIEIDDERN